MTHSIFATAAVALLASATTVMLTFTAACPFAAKIGVRQAVSHDLLERNQAAIHNIASIPNKWDTSRCNKRCLRARCHQMITDNKGSEAADLLRAVFHDSQACALDGSLRFELDRRENSGLEDASGKAVSAAYSCKCSIADTYSLCSGMAVTAAGGPKIRMRWGHKDAGKANPPNNMPSGRAGADALRKVLKQYNDREIVLLSSAHNLGHVHRRGRDGKITGEIPFTTNQDKFTNQYFQNLKLRYYLKKAPENTFQLPSDLALIEDKNMREWVFFYAGHDKRYFRDFRRFMDRMINDFSTCDEKHGKSSTDKPAGVDLDDDDYEDDDDL